MGEGKRRLLFQHGSGLASYVPLAASNLVHSDDDFCLHRFTPIVQCAATVVSIFVASTPWPSATVAELKH